MEEIKVTHLWTDGLQPHLNGWTGGLLALVEDETVLVLKANRALL